MSMLKSYGFCNYFQDKYFILEFTNFIQFRHTDISNNMIGTLNLTNKYKDIVIGLLGPFL